MTSASDFELVRFEPAHFDAIDLQDAQLISRAFTTPDYLADLAAGPAYTLIRGGAPICAFGLKEFGPDRGMLWSYLARHSGPYLGRIRRCALRFLSVFDRPEITSTCQTGFAAGARLLSLLGFEFVRPLGPFGRAGIPHDLYLRVR